MKVICFAVLAWVAFAVICQAQSPRRDRAAIAKVKRLSVSKLDRKLSPKPLSQWIQGVVGRSRRIAWEVNDCGEQDGSGDQKDFPICVGADTKLRDGTEVSILVVVGSYRRGVVGKPQIWWIYLKNKEGALTDVDRLGQLPGALRTRR